MNGSGLGTFPVYSYSTNALGEPSKVGFVTKHLRGIQKKVPFGRTSIKS